MLHQNDSMAHMKRPENGLYVGKVFHERHQPFSHKFRYSVFSIWFDLDNPPKSRFLSFNRCNILSFWNKDHGNRSGEDIRPWIENAAKDKNIDMTGGKIYCLSFPRLWGYIFNPLTVFYCYDRSEKLAAILYEVKNTFGEQHGYFMPVEEQTEIIKQSCKKIFHVSPFIQMECTYNFRVREPSDTIDVAIHQFQPDGKILTATWNGTYRPLTDNNILRTVLTHPLMSFKIITAIHWEALWIWAKGAKYINRPELPDKDIS